MRPITTSLSGGFRLTSLLDQPRHGVRQLRALALPVRQPLAVDAQPLAAFRRLRIVEADALDEAAVARSSRIGHYQVVERALLRPTACQTYDDHVFLPAPKCGKGVILRYFFAFSQDKSGLAVTCAGPPPGAPMSTRPESPARGLEQALTERFGATFSVDPAAPGLEELARMAAHRSHRKFARRAVDPALLRLRFACALSAPSKSDLQQADIVHIMDRAKVKAIADGIPDMPWIADAPVFLLFLANHRRLRLISEWRGKTFANDHLDHFLNAAADAAIVLTSFIRAAEAVGLGACPISHVRNHSDELARMLELPDWVFPVAGLCVGYPAEAGRISPRLPLEVTVHVDRYDETGLRDDIDAYDRRRHATQPYRKQRHAERHGTADFYGWSEDKARQYSVTERADFGAFVRSKKFSLK